MIARASSMAYKGGGKSPQAVAKELDVREKEKALDNLEPLLKVPYYLTPKWLAIDPNFAPLEGHPRFEKLLQSLSLEP